MISLWRGHRQRYTSRLYLVLPLEPLEQGDAMVKWLMRRQLAAFERQWHYDASYMHRMIEADPRAAWRFQGAAALGKYRKDVPTDALAAAAITAARHEDCGP